jgi:predicted amidohydrolase
VGMMEKLRLGLVIAREEKELSELKRFIGDSSVDAVLFPEGYMSSDSIGEACKLAKLHKKWVISGVEDHRDKGKFFETAVVINPQGKVVGEHRKTSITRYEIEHKYSRGDSIEIFPTEIGTLGLAICYELHLPEISRVLALDGAWVIFNPIGTGMWHERQYELWNNLAATRAAENGVFVVGCSHFNDAIPIAFAYAPNGECLVRERSINKMIPITLDPTKYTIGRNFDQRRPELYGRLVGK